jgi:hypothetical protein
MMGIPDLELVPKDLRGYFPRVTTVTISFHFEVDPGPVMGFPLILLYFLYFPLVVPLGLKEWNIYYY